MKVVECLVIIVQKHNILWHYSLFCIIPQGVKELWKFCKYSSMKGWKNKSACPTVFHIANRDKMNCKSWPWKLHLAIQIIERGDLRTVMLPYTFTQLSGWIVLGGSSCLWPSCAFSFGHSLFHLSIHLASYLTLVWWLQPWPLQGLTPKLATTHPTKFTPMGTEQYFLHPLTVKRLR